MLPILAKELSFKKGCVMSILDYTALAVAVVLFILIWFGGSPLDNVL